MNIRPEQNAIQNTSYSLNEWEGKTATKETGVDSPLSKGEFLALSSLSKGDVIRGIIQDIRNPYVVIELENHQLIDALLTEKFSFNIADKVIFQVKENADGLLALRPIMALEQNEAIIQKALLAANMPATDKNKAFVAALVEQGMPIDKASIMQLSNASKVNPSIQLSTLVTMKQMNIPLTPQNTQIFEQWESGTLSLEKQTEQMLSHIYDTVIQSIEDESPIQGLSLQEKIFSMVFEKNESPVSTAYAPFADSYVENSANGNDIPTTFDNVSSESQSFVTNQLPPDSLWNQLTKAMEKKTESFDNKEFLSNTSGITETATKPEDDFIPQNEKKISSDFLTKEDILSYINQNSTEQNPSETFQLPIIKEFTREQFDAFRQAFLQVLESPQKLDNHALKTLLKREDVKHLLLTSEKERFCISLKQVEESKENLKDILQTQYEKIRQTGMNLVQLLDENGKETTMVKASNGELQNQMQFLEHFSQNVTYMPILVKFTSSQTQGEFYIWSNKKKKYAKEDALTAFLHFDLENLGATDIHIRLQERKLSAHFQLEDKQSAKIVSKHLSQLKERLEAKGFMVDCDAHIKKEETPIQQQILQEEKTPVIRRYNFDVRA